MNSATNGLSLYKLLTKENWHASRKHEASVYVYIWVFTVFHTVLKYSRNRLYQVIQSLEVETCYRSALQPPFNMTFSPVDKWKRENKGWDFFGFYKTFDSVSRSILWTKCPAYS